MNDNLVLQLLRPATQTIELSAPVADGTRATILCDTTESWSRKTEYIPTPSTICVYTDRSVIDGVKYAGVKIGDGTTYVVDLPFVGDDVAIRIISVLNEHIGDTGVHVTPEEKSFWNNKLNLQINEETLILNRN